MNRDELPGRVLLEWTPIPLRPWVVRGVDGPALKRFHEPDQALRWMERHGYAKEEPPRRA